MTPAEYKALRERLGYTQAEWAALQGVSRETVNRREAGDARYPISVATALAVSSLGPKRKSGARVKCPE